MVYRTIVRKCAKVVQTSKVGSGNYVQFLQQKSVMPLHKFWNMLFFWFLFSKFWVVLHFIQMAQIQHALPSSIPILRRQPFRENDHPVHNCSRQTQYIVVTRIPHWWRNVRDMSRLAGQAGYYQHLCAIATHMTRLTFWQDPPTRLNYLIQQILLPLFIESSHISSYSHFCITGTSYLINIDIFFSFTLWFVWFYKILMI